MTFKIFMHNLFAIIVAALLLVACASNTKLTSNWKNPNVVGAQPLRKVAVFVIAKDETVRRYAEDQMVSKLPKDVTGVAGYTMFDKPEKNVSKVRELLIKNGFDGALVTRLTHIKESEEYIPSQTVVNQTRPLSGPAGGAFDGYYGRSFDASYVVSTTESYTVTNTNVFVETKLYKLPDGVLLWSGTTDTLNPDVKSELVDGITEIIKAEINQDGLLGGK